MSSSDLARQVGLHLERWYQALGRELGEITRPQRRLMRCIAEEDGLTVGRLAHRMGRGMAGITRALDRLEAMRLLRRYREAGDDQRLVRLALTDTGRAALSHADRLYTQRVNVSLEPLSLVEQRELLRLLEHVTLALREEPESIDER